MVKRKAIKSVDAWLQEGEEAAATKPATPRKAPAVVDLPTVEIGPTSVAGNEVANPPSEVAVTNEVVESQSEVAVTSEEAARWFWNLLEQAGFELV